MQENDRDAKTDVVKLFVVLMVISAIGFGVGAAYLYHHQSTCSALIETEKRAMGYIKKIALSPENRPFWGFEPSRASRTTGADLASYLLRKAQTHGVPIDGQHTDQDKHREYAETKVNLKLSDVTLEQIVRYLYNVQQGKNDIFITSLRLTNFDYDQPVPACKATLDFVVFEEIETQSK